MPEKAQNVTDLPKNVTFDKKQIAIGAGLALTGVAAIVVLRNKLAGRFPVDVDVNVAAPKKN